MNYYQMKISAETRRTTLENEAQHDHLAALLRERRASIRAIHVEINVVGRLTHWRLQWKLHSETKVTSYDPIPYSR